MHSVFLIHTLTNASLIVMFKGYLRIFRAPSRCIDSSFSFPDFDLRNICITYCRISSVSEFCRFHDNVKLEEWRFTVGRGDISAHEKEEHNQNLMATEFERVRIA